MIQPNSQSSPARFFHGRALILKNEKLARGTYLIRLRAPEMAAFIRPGQFLMIRQIGSSDPLLGRPFALYDTVLDAQGNPAGIDVVYLVVGKLTSLLASLSQGDEVEIWGPLGNGFPDLSEIGHVALIAGGIGQTPFLAYIRSLLGKRGYGGQQARQQAQRVSIYYGVRSADLAAGIEDFRQAGATLHLSSDDGSTGYHGLVTDLLEKHLREENSESSRPQHLIGCGPEPMMKALSDLAQRWDIPCHLSLETPMACGIGICFSCVTPVKTSDGWDYRRVCVDGPVFDAAELVWEHGAGGDYHSVPSPS